MFPDESGAGAPASGGCPRPAAAAKEVLHRLAGEQHVVDWAGPMASNEADEELHHFGMVVREAGLPPRPLKALVVDDDADFREMLCALLKGMGIEPIEARHGHEALWLLDEERPNIVFLDHRMPGLLGASIAKSMRATGHNVQVVLTTAEQNIDEIARAAGTMKLAKPFSVNQLRDTVLRAIGR